MTDQTTPMKQEEWKKVFRENPKLVSDLQAIIDDCYRDGSLSSALLLMRGSTFISQLLLQKEQEVREGIKEKIDKLTIYYTIKDENIDLMGNQPVYRTEDVENSLK